MSRVPEWIFSQRRHRHDQQTHAKMLNITYQGNANQNYNEMLPHLSEWLFLPYNKCWQG